MNLYRISFLALSLSLAACANRGPNTDFMDNDGYTVKVVTDEYFRNPDILRVVEQEQFRNVIVVKREANSTPNQITPDLNPEAIEGALQQIKIRRNKEPQALFLANETKILSLGLAKALSSTKENEDVVFYYPQERGGGLITEKLMTVGRVFVQNDKLNIIFGTIQETYEGQWLKARMLRRFKPGSRQASNLTDWSVINNKQATVDATRKDWVQIKLVADAAAPAKTAAPVTAESRLQKLQQLKDKGLINDDEFNVKRQQILDSL